MPEVKSKVKIQKSKLEKPKEQKKAAGLSVSLYNLLGKEDGNLSLPKEIFGTKVNKPLLSQAIRIYQNNATSHNSNTKTRAEVKGSSRKIRAQKGTGGARHGNIRAPIFVGGGVTFASKYRKTILDFPKKMKKSALISAFSAKMEQSEIIGITGLNKSTGKTKEVKGFLTKLKLKSAIFIIASKNEEFIRSAHNMPKTLVRLIDEVNILELIKYKTLIIEETAVAVLEKRIISGKKEEVKA
jgi:large subunit ribosomal protein L4